MMNEIGPLYGVRSKLVHNGNADVTDSDLASIRYYTKNVILTLLVRTPFMLMNSEKELMEWFDNSLLAS